jgi:hypothetical protein
VWGLRQGPQEPVPGGPPKAVADPGSPAPFWRATPGIGRKPAPRERFAHSDGSDGIAMSSLVFANGDPMAIVQGSVGLIGCHLESQKHWYTKKVMQPHWHENTHHPLLWQFVANHLLQTQQMTLF